MAHNIMVMGQMWTFRRWVLARHYSLEEYTGLQTALLLRDLSLERRRRMSVETKIYRTKHTVRFVTAASLFDGHDASINLFRRLLQASGAEVIHLGHNRSVDEIVEAAIQEDVQGIAVSSYQGGHIEFFKYMIDLLKERGAGPTSRSSAEGAASSFPGKSASWRPTAWPRSSRRRTGGGWGSRG